MKLVETETDETKTPPEPELRNRKTGPPTPKTQRGQSLLRTLAAILVAIILIVLIVFLARWIYHKTHHKVQPTSGTSQQSSAQSSANKTSGAQPGSNSNASTPAPSSSSGSNSQIANTGPGNVVAIFVGSSLAAAGLHYIISVRRFSKTGV